MSNNNRNTIGTLLSHGVCIAHGR